MERVPLGKVVESANGYLVTKEEVRVDRSRAGANDFSDVYTDSLHSIAHASRLKSGNVDMEILFDVSYLEVASMTVYPDLPYDKIEINGNLKVKKYKL